MSSVPRGHFSVSRSLADFDAKFGAGAILRAIEGRRRTNAPVRVLEIGCGEGRVLMELRKMYPDAELHGINRKPWELMQGSGSLAETATHYRIFGPGELPGLALPAIHFCDAASLPFPSDHFDVIVSQVAVPYVARKDLMLAEAWRVLKPGATAFLHMDSTRGDETGLAGGDSPCFVLYRDKERVAAADYFTEIRSRGFDARYEVRRAHEFGRDRSHFLLVMNRNTGDPLALDLVFDEQDSFNFTSLHKSPQDWQTLWGFRSLYHIGA
jgi:SAM-dependent methyltransferase